MTTRLAELCANIGKFLHAFCGLLQDPTPNEGYGHDSVDQEPVCQ